MTTTIICPLFMMAILAVAKVVVVVVVLVLVIVTMLTVLLRDFDTPGTNPKPYSSGRSRAVGLRGCGAERGILRSRSRRRWVRFCRCYDSIEPLGVRVGVEVEADVEAAAVPVVVVGYEYCV
jgi:hypothetical protein